MSLGDILTMASFAKDVAELTTSEKAKIWFKSLFGKRIPIAVYGDSGVGKTQFMRTLTGKNRYLIVNTRTRSIHEHKTSLRTGRKIKLIDLPGHASLKSARDTVLNDITRGKITCVINLVNYGYQDSEQLRNEPSLAFKTGTSEVKPEYLNENRKREIQRTKEIVERIGHDVKLKWMITVINKADIWNKNREEVEDYYKNGEYYNVIESLQKATYLEVRPFCSVITPFGNKEMLLSYSDQDKYTDYDSLMSLLEEILK